MTNELQIVETTCSGKLWEIMTQSGEDTYTTAIATIAKEGINRAKTIRETFPLYTLHDEIHINNVLRIMAELLGDHIEKLTRNEAAMLILAACCHDIGMSYSEEEKERVLSDTGRVEKYLKGNTSEYVKAYASGSAKPEMTEEMKLNYLRSIHHERVGELLSAVPWPRVLLGNLSCRDLIAVCQSHGNDASCINDLEPTRTIDLRLCAILLRLADILDFDGTRAPLTIYKYNCFHSKHDAASKFSEMEWQKHLSSAGFDFANIPDRSFPYELDCYANCKSVQVEQSVRRYLDWVDVELAECRQLLSAYRSPHSELVLPRKVARHIEFEGYVSGEYKLTLDQAQVLNLLVGRDLYQDSAVFVRELLQNAIDAVRTREQMNPPADWKPQINISTWMDDDGYHWFRIEDNGIGMTKDIIRDHFLKIGSSYYNSVEFQKEKLLHGADPGYMPISRFGIGILSCFMGDEQTNLVEVSTKHFEGDSPALRMRMSGLSGYYYLASEKEYHHPGEMQGRKPEEKVEYRSQPGTVIAVRTNLYRTGKYHGFKEILDRYIVYPAVPVHYDGNEGSFDYPTEKEFMDIVHNIHPSEDLYERGLLEFSLSDAQINKLQEELPSLVFTERPKLQLKCIAFDSYTKSPYLSGAMLLAKVAGNAENIILNIAGETVTVSVAISVAYDKKQKTLGLQISLRFLHAFDHKMESVKYKLMDAEYDLSNLHRKYKSFSLTHEIVDAVTLYTNDDPQWRENIMRRENISAKELDSMIAAVKKDIDQQLGITSEERKLIDHYFVYEKISKPRVYPLCDLNDFDWYQKYFLPVQNDSDELIAVAHNGVYCASPKLFKRSYPCETIATVILLKDEYRPTVDLARDRIRHLPLETACELEIICTLLTSQGMSIFSSWNSLDEANFAFTPANTYLSVLQKRPDFVDRLRIKTDNELLTAKELIGYIERGEHIQFTDPPALKNRATKNENLYSCLCTAYLRSKYHMYIELSKQYSPKVFIVGTSDNTGDKTLRFFPPHFFLPVQKKTQYLTEGRSYYRYACNESHPLSQFIINNAEQLKTKVPGLFLEMLRSIAEDNTSDVIRTINDILKRLKQLRDSGISVPADLKLTEDDFS